MSIKGAIIAVLLTYVCGVFITYDFSWVLGNTSGDRSWVLYGLGTAAFLGAIAPKLMDNEGGE